MKQLCAAIFLLLCGAAPAPRLEIAITVDDLPVHAPYPPGVTPLQVNREMIAGLKAAQSAGHRLRQRGERQ